MSRIGANSENSHEEKIKKLEQEIRALKVPEEPPTAEKFFENKIFN